MAKAAKIKTYNANGYILNLKVISTERQGEQILNDLFKEIHRRKIVVKVSSDREIAIRTCVPRIDGRVTTISGNFVSAINLQGMNWLNQDNLEIVETPQVAANLKAGSRDVQYILVQKAHRVFIESKLISNVGHLQIVKFLQIALKQVLRPDENIEIFVEKDNEAIIEIMEASKIEWLTIKISRSNNDTNDESKQQVEDFMDAIGAREFDTKYVAKDKEIGLDISQSPIVRGSLELASSNGYAEARIKDGNRSRKLKTNQYEKKYIVEYTQDKVKSVIDFVMSKFRNNTPPTT